MTTTPLRRRAIVLGASLLSASLLLSACSDGSDPTASESAADTTRTVEAGNGTVEVPADPQRIVTIGNASVVFTELGGEPLGVTTYTLGETTAEQQALFDAATNVGPSGGEVDLEKVAGLKPDLILAWMPQDDWDQVGDQLKTIAPAVFTGFDWDRLDVVEVIAEATNLSDELTAQKTAYEERVAEIKQTHSEAIENFSFAGVSRGSWMDTGMFKFGLADDLCTTIATDEVGLDIPAPSRDYKRSFEQLGELADYDAILYPVDFNGDVLESFVPVTETSAWQALPAVQSGNTIGVTCTSHGAYTSLSHYVEQLDQGLATLSKSE